MANDRASALRRAREKSVQGYSEPYLNHEVIAREGLHVWKCAEGDQFLRVLPFSEEDYYGYELHLHYNIGPDGDTVLCPRKMKKDPCPICQMRNKLKIQGREWDDPMMQALRVGSPRYLFYVVDVRSSKTMSEGTGVYVAPATVNKAILGFTRDRRTGEDLDIFGEMDREGFLVPGNVLEFERVGKGMRTSYEGFILRPETDAIDPAFYENLPHPTDLLVFLDYEEILDLFDMEAVMERLNAEAEAEEDDSPGEYRTAPKGRRRKPSTSEGSRTRRPRATKEEDDEEQDEEHDEEDTPRRRPRAARDDEGDEEDTPRRRPRKRKPKRQEPEEEEPEAEEPEEEEPEKKKKKDSNRKRRVADRIKDLKKKRESEAGGDEEEEEED